ncbi:MAG TPA: hypothetical protein VFF35_12285 [Bacteroidia bacterium]|nr:hypothetical protein [Bacteroidia bacterium]
MDNFLSPGCNFGYDVMEYIGYAIWRKSHTASQIQSDLLLQNNLTISESEITYLAKKFVHYVVEAQKDKLAEIKNFLHRGGGYFLYFDAMHPGDGAAHIMCAVAEEISEKINIVLGSAKLSKESTETVAAFFRELKEKYGNPLAGICDMLASNLAAFREVFPGVLLLICQFHLLRSLGKEFLDYETSKLQNILKQYDVTRRLKEVLKNCKESIDADPQLAEYLTYDEKKYRSSFQILPGVVKAYCKIQWTLAYEQELNGYGAPFDRSEFVYLQRMKKAYDSLKEYSLEFKELSELKFLLACILEDPDFKKQMAAMERKVEDFDHLRAIMKIAPTGGGKGLNDDGEECDITMMEEQLKVFIESNKIKNNSDKAYKKMIKQILKYWKMLFAEPIEARLPNGEIVLVYPGRTSNILERLFREFQRLEYKRTGMGTLGRTVRAMIAETPMMKNLECPEFMNIILNGQPTLAARFAQLDKKHFKERMNESQNKEKLPAGLKKNLNNPDFHKVFMNAAKLVKKSA